MTAALAAIACAATAAPIASAHALLLETRPSRGAVVPESPTRVELTFNEPVESALGSIRIYDGHANPADTGELERSAPEVVAVPIEEELARGTYTVAWRVVSADSDPISGAFVFHVEAPGQQPAGVAAEVLEGTPRLVAILYPTARFFDYLLLLLCAGGCGVLAFVLRTADPRLRGRLYLAVSVSAAALAPLVLAELVLQGAAGSGSTLSDALSGDVVAAVADTRFGELALGRAGLAVMLALTAFTLSRRPDARLAETVCVPVAAAMLLTPVGSGHASVSGSLAFLADFAHVLAASTWTGGLAFVVAALVLARDHRWSLAARCVPCFSTLAVGSVVVLVVAGTANGYLQVRAWRGLWETTYGLLLLAKVALVLPLLALGAFNNRSAVPRLRAGLASVAERRRFLRVAGAELVLMTGIVAVTAVLVSAEPAGTALERHGPLSRLVRIGPLEATLGVEPARLGTNEIHLDFGGHGGGGPDLAEVRVAATLEAARIGPLRFRARPAGSPSAWVVQRAQLPIAGVWTLRIEVRRGEFELFTQKVLIRIEE